MEYRIKEEFNKFYPQAKMRITKTTNFWGKKESVEEWVYMDEYTNKPIEEYTNSRDRGNHQRNVVCVSLRDAKLYILSLSKGVVYHKWHERKKV